MSVKSYLPAFLGMLLFSCSPSSVDKITTGVKSISKCCKNISLVASPAKLLSEDEEALVYPAQNNADALMPSNSWDTKMSIW